jgi:threonine/homoserine/homoserine lactone efflux protein
MPDGADFGLFLAAALVIALTPGPGIFYVAARTLAGGRLEGMASSLGTGLGGLVHVLAGAFGVSTLLMASVDAFALAKLAGAFYLVYLGIKAWRSAAEPAPLRVEATGAARAFREGIVVEALNPKTAAFFLAFIPQFVRAGDGHAVWHAFVLLGLVSVLLNTAADVVVVLAAARFRAGLAARPRVLQRLRQGAASVLCGLGLSLALARRPG